MRVPQYTHRHSTIRMAALPSRVEASAIMYESSSPWCDMYAPLPMDLATGQDCAGRNSPPAPSPDIRWTLAGMTTGYAVCMPFYEVEIRAWIEAGSEADARSVALGEEPREPGRLVLAESARVLETDAAQAARITGFAGMIDAALPDQADPRFRR